MIIVAYSRALMSISSPDLPSLTKQSVLLPIFSGQAYYHQKYMQVDQPPAKSREESPCASPSATPGMRWAIGVALLISLDERVSYISCSSACNAGKMKYNCRKLWTRQAVSDIAKDCIISPIASKGAFFGNF